MTEQLITLLESDVKGDVLLSLSLSEIVENPEVDPTFAEMLGRVLYHAVLRIYHVNGLGKYCVDTLNYDMLFSRIRQFSGE